MRTMPRVKTFGLWSAWSALWGALCGALLVGLACATVSVKGGDVTLVREELARSVLERGGYRVSRVERTPLSIQEARALPRGTGSSFGPRSTHTADKTEVHGARSDGLARITIVEASAAVWPQGKPWLQKDRVSGTVLWLEGEHLIETWCFSFVRDDVDPDCAIELMSGLATAVGAPQR